MDISQPDLGVTALYTGCLAELIDACKQAGTLISRQDLYTAWNDYLIDMGRGMARLNIDSTWLILPSLQWLYRQSRDVNGLPFLVETVVDQIQTVLDSLALDRAA